MVDPLLIEEMEMDDEMEEDPLSYVSVRLGNEDDEEDEEVQCEPDIKFQVSKRGSKDLMYHCAQCSLQFPNKISLNLHLLRAHVNSRDSSRSESITSCPICDKVPCTDLTTHCRNEHSIDGVVCPICAKILSKTCTLNRHIEQVHLNMQIHKPAKCDTCGKVFSKKGHLDRHIRTIHMGIKETSQPCPFCGKIFSTKSSLDPHIDMVHKGVRKECPTCGKILSDLWKHMRTVHGYYRRKAKVPKEETIDSLLSEDKAPKSVYCKEIPTKDETTHDDDNSTAYEDRT
nr:zinc finger protein 594-like [Lepeophtheirus salmonis]